MTEQRDKAPRSERLVGVLLAVHELGGKATASQVAQHGGWDAAIARKAVENAKQMGYAETCEQRGLEKAVRLTERGADKIKPLIGRGKPVVDADLVRGAMALIKAAALGADSIELAGKLDATQQAVEASLAEETESGRLVCCRIKRQIDGVLTAALLYRVSTAGSTALLDWRHKGNGAAHYEAPAVADEVMEAAPPPPPQPAAHKLPFAGELDIDAVYKRHRHQEEPPAAAAPAKPEGRFVCWIDSDGEMMIHANGDEVNLSVAHTKRLLHYIEQTLSGARA